jgi:hypothetical protein
MEEEEEGVFEIVDYTAASPWERFINSVEAILSKWGVENGQLGLLDPSSPISTGVSLDTESQNSQKIPFLDTILSSSSSASASSSSSRVSLLQPTLLKESVSFGDQQFTIMYQFLPLPSPASWKRFDLPSKISFDEHETAFEHTHAQDFEDGQLHDFIPISRGNYLRICDNKTC